MSEEIKTIPIDDEIDINNFNCGNNSINLLLRNAYYKQVFKLASTKAIILDDKVIGYYMVSTIPYDDHIIEANFTAISLDVLCIDISYQDNHIGTSVLYDIILMSKQFSDFAGCRYLILNALKERYFWYLQRGFTAFDPNDIFDDSSTIKMFIDFRDDNMLQDYIEQ